MIGLGTLSAFEEIESLLKSKLGDFLTAEQKLRSLQNNPSITIRAKASGLLAVQKSLETEMKDAQTKIANFQTGAWSISDAIALGDVGTRLLSHLKDVASLEKEAGGVVQAELLPGSTASYLGLTAVAAAALFLLLRK